MSLCHSSCNELLLLLTCNSCNAWVLTYKCLRQSAQHDLFPRNVLKAEERLLVEKRIMTLFYTPTFCVSIWIFFLKYCLSSPCLCFMHSFSPSQHELKHRERHLNVRKASFSVRMISHWSRLLSAVEESPSLEESGAGQPAAAYPGHPRSAFQPRWFCAHQFSACLQCCSNSASSLSSMHSPGCAGHSLLL